MTDHHDPDIQEQMDYEALNASTALQLTQARAEIERLEDALRDLFAMMDEGLLVRDISQDHDPMWALRALEFTQRLAKAQQVLSPTQEVDDE